MRCQHCKADFTPEDLETIRTEQEKRRKGRFSGLAVIVGLVFLIFLVGRCASNDASVDATETEELASTNSALPLEGAGKADEAAAPASKWDYSRRRDEVRNGEIIEARVRSTNTVDLDFPYGTVGLTIHVRKHPEWGQDVMFIVDKGQILCRIDGCSGTVNFDGSTEKLSLNESADNDSSVVFASYGPAIIDKLKRSKSVIVELPFYSNGNRQFRFETAGLEWLPQKID